MDAYNSNQGIKRNVVRMATENHTCCQKYYKLLATHMDIECNHLALAQALGLPVFLIRMAEKIDGEFYGKLYEAIAVGKDLSQMREDFLAWLLNHPRWGVAQYTKDEDVLKVAAMFGSGEEFSAEEWREAIYATHSMVANAPATAIAAAWSAYSAAAAEEDDEDEASFGAAKTVTFVASSVADKELYWSDVQDFVLNYVSTPMPEGRGTTPPIRFGSGNEPDNQEENER